MSTDGAHESEVCTSLTIGKQKLPTTLLENAGEHSWCTHKRGLYKPDHRQAETAYHFKGKSRYAQLVHTQAGSVQA